MQFKKRYCQSCTLLLQKAVIVDVVKMLNTIYRFTFTILR